MIVRHTERLLDFWWRIPTKRRDVFHAEVQWLSLKWKPDRQRKQIHETLPARFSLHFLARFWASPRAERPAVLAGREFALMRVSLETVVSTSPYLYWFWHP
jgi:hypothetical protein